MSAKLEWTFDEPWEGIQDEIFARLQQAVTFAWTQTILALNVPRDKETRRRKRATAGGPKGSTYIRYILPPEGNPQRGGPPGLRTGWLRSHVQTEFDRAEIKGRIGLIENAKYGLFLELGNWPWLWATFQKWLPQIEAIMGTQQKAA